MAGPKLSGLTDKLLALDPVAFWFLVTLAVMLAIAGFYFAFRYLRRARIIQDTPTSKIRSAAQGYLELDGRGELMEGEPIVAPLTGKTCTWYRYKVEKREVRHSQGKRRETWRTLRNGVSDSLFLLVDDSGQCIIDPEGAEVTPSARDVWYGHSQQPPHGPRSNGVSLLATGDYRYTEERMHPADPLYALGLFKTVGGAGDLGSSRHEINALLRAWKQDKQHMLQHFDANGDGNIDMKEWEDARKKAHSEVVKARAERAAKAGTNLMVKPADRRRPYLLSVLPQTRLAKRFQWLAWGSLAGFFFAGVLASWMVSVRFGV